ncbi:MAG: 4-hydroxy-tetrahydrodipicolinate reductase [Bacteroidaceae bacterium]|nr:4-hydroxy-tetrahydrodipicolinate reductase [Bacteroidaceae bacterium]
MKIALVGYGKMGRMIEGIALSRGHEIVCKIDVDNQQDFESEAFRTADVAIEFTAPSVAYGNVQRCFQAGVKVVSGSTGWMAAHADEVRRRCSEEGKTLFWSSNFSVGVYIFGAVNKYLSRIMNGFPEYQARMEEVHHIHKLDHPSGTAITLAEQIIQTHPQPLSGEGGLDREQAFSSPVSSPQEGGGDGVFESHVGWVPITSFRRGEVPGIHSITWDSEADQITITHDAHSRKGFALGAVLAAEYTATHTGLLTMDDLFHF